jgi:hypothetical protein
LGNGGDRCEVHPMSVNQKNKKYSNYSLTALGLVADRRIRKGAKHGTRWTGGL